MILSKQVGVYLNQVHNLFKQGFVTQLANNHIDLTAEQYLLLDLLWDEGALTQQKIAQQMEKDKNSITKLLDGLEKKEYVIRVNDPEDRRKKIIVVTRKGHRQKRKITRIAIQAADTILDGIPIEELNLLVAVLNKLGDNIKKMLQEK